MRCKQLPFVLTMRIKVNVMKKFRSIAALLSLIIFLCACSVPDGGSGELPHLKIGSDIYRPFSYINEEGIPDGADVAVAREACAIMGYEPEFVYIDWDKKDSLLASGAVDCLWGCFSENGRDDDYLWTEPYMSSRQVVAVRCDSDIETLSDLDGMGVAVQLSSKPEEIFLDKASENIPDVKTVYSLLTMDEVVTAMKKGYTDACAGHEDALRVELERSDTSYRFLDGCLMRSQIGVAFYKGGDGSLRDELDRALSQLKKSGSLSRILGKYDVRAEAEGEE